MLIRRCLDGPQMPGNEEVVKRLDTLIYLTLNQAPFDKLTERERIQTLKGLGFTDTEIATMIGKTRGYVSSIPGASGRRKS